MNRCSLFHITEFTYDGPVSESYNEVRLRPRQDDTQTCLSFRLATNPAAKASAYQDPYRNWVHRFNVLPEHRHLRVEADSVVLVHEPRPLPDNGLALRDLADQAEALDEFYDLLCAAASLVHEHFRYEKGATHVQSSIEDALRTRAGVCQDFAHLLLAMLRMRGLPARYVSGYLAPNSTAEPGASAAEVVGGQASHAWMEVYLPGEGWFGLDPTLGEPVDLLHVRSGLRP
jgi:transglutaminase-like putative cysteine protease